MAKRFKYNQKDYEFYVCNYKTGRIYSGWEFLEDAKDAMKELPKEFNAKIYRRKYCLQQGIDIDNNSTWED